MSDFITLNTIIGNGKSYQIPIYQRDYSWSSEDWEDLWLDILEIPKEKTHYLGYLVLQPNNAEDESFWVIDGQQRLTTLSILALSVIALLKKWATENIEKENNTIRESKEIERYVGNYSTSKLTITPKLTLNRNNDDFYKSYLLQFRQPTSVKKLKESDRLLYGAYTYFFQKLEEKFNNNKSGADLTIFLEKTVGSGIVFTEIIVNNELDAFKVFETLNARGVKLSPADLLKNYIFKLVSQLGEKDLDEAERRWNSLNAILSNSDITTYIRHFWNSKYGLARENELFKRMKLTVVDAKGAFELLNILEKQATFYNGFKTSYDTDLWDKDERAQLLVLDLLNVSTCYSLMLAFLENLPRNDFAALLKEISSISLRYSISELNPNTAEAVYSKVANQIYKKELTDAKSVVQALKPIYVADENFVLAFSTTRIKTKTKKAFVKYLLVELENQISATKYQYEDSTATIEHILPENPGEIWNDSFPHDIQEEYISRLGNYTLLKGKDNKSKNLSNNASFSEKLEIYKKSQYKLSSEYCSYDDFTPNTLQKRQERLAKVAKSIWKSAFIK